MLYPRSTLLEEDSVSTVNSHNGSTAFSVFQKKVYFPLHSCMVVSVSLCSDVIQDAIGLFTASLLPCSHYIAYKWDNQEQVCV